ncbi:MAG: hypothetical protein GTO42_10735 [Candidatus Latescibacteria bacterium]|nr:hypothetical protein [Candidatus Latescibacterota bacterium]
MKVTEEKAKELAETFAERHLPGFRVERILPFEVHQIVYSVDLQNSGGEHRTLRVNPHGEVIDPWKYGMRGRRPEKYRRPKK